jgi:hypothetical protein
MPCIPLPVEIAARNQVYNNFRSHAKMRGFDFELTMEQAEVLFKSNCYYCGIEPKQVKKHPTGKINPNRKWILKNYFVPGGDYVYNGIDRKDNNKGYSLENCVPCCGRCNRAKDTTSYDEFLQYIDRLIQHRIRIGG